MLVGGPDAVVTPLSDLVRELGLARIEPYTDRERAEQQVARTPLCFFLFAEVPDPVLHAPVLSALRHARRRQLRFAPLAYFAESPSLAVTSRCLAMGFDDVMTMPFTPAKIRARLERQIGRAVEYLGAKTYFGPDRRPLRKRVGGNAPAPGGEARHYLIRRDPDHGVLVLRERALMAADAAAEAPGPLSAAQSAA